jgi:endonuclease YncB( thermonuclease family)
MIEIAQVARFAYSRIMVTVTRLLSVSRPGNAIVLSLVFALGLAIGAALAPVGATRSGEAREPVSVRTTDAAAPSTAPNTLRAGHPVEVLRVLDGDTFEARVRLWPGLEITTKVRLRGIDAPELRARCDEERAKAIAARDTLQAILDQGDVGISTVTLDKYGGRVVADASTRATPDVSAELLGAGLARSYAGGRRDTWCPQLPTP